MKKLLLISLMLLTLTNTACSSESEVNTTQEQPETPGGNEDDNHGGSNGNNNRYLILYCSRTGNTKAMAEEICKILDCDILEVIPAIPYDEDYSSMLARSQREQAAIGQGDYPEIRTSVEKFEDYEIIFIGYPIWNGHMATPMQTFLHNHADKLSGKQIALFASSGSSGISTSINDAYSLVADAIFVETLLFTSGAMGQIESRIASWLELLNAHNEENNENNMENDKIKLTAGSKTFTATLVDNSSVKALKELLNKGDIHIDMSDYGNMEKVGSLGMSLPRNDEYITTAPGDLILYQGNLFVIYYAPNTYSFTRLGKIDNVTRDELVTELGSGNITVTLSLN